MEHHFSPIDYHISLGPHEPVLRVADGDTIVTTTVDARGFDANREQFLPRGGVLIGVDAGEACAECYCKGLPCSSRYVLNGGNACV